MATAAAKKRSPARVKRGPAKQPQDPNGMLTGVRAAWEYIRRRNGTVMPLRTFGYHCSEGHIPHLKLGAQYLFWPRELREHFRLPDDAA